MKTPELVFGVTPAEYKKKGQAKPVNVAEIAVIQEYGTEKIPPRPAFRRGLEEGVKVNKKLIGAQLKNLVQRAAQGRMSEVHRSLVVMLTQIGKSAKAKTKEIISTGDETPNAPATVAKKGFDHPLFETGLLLEHVDYEVKK